MPTDPSLCNPGPARDRSSASDLSSAVSQDLVERVIRDSGLRPLVVSTTG